MSDDAMGKARPGREAQADLSRHIEHVWRYFELHANQRITTFNYFLILSGAVAAGLASTLQGSQRFSSLGVVLGLILAMTSFVFWKLDQRVSFLIKHAESALREVEQSFDADVFQLFDMDPRESDARATTVSWWSRMWTYGKAFRIIFAMMGLLGVAGSAFSALRCFGVITW